MARMTKLMKEKKQQVAEGGISPGSRGSMYSLLLSFFPSLLLSFSPSLLLILRARLGGFQGEQILVSYYFDMRSAKITDYVLTIVLKTCKKIIVRASAEPRYIGDIFQNSVNLPKKQLLRDTEH